MLDFYTIIISFILLIIFVLYVFTKVPQRYTLKFVIIPLIIGLAFLGTIKIESLLGRPYEKVPSDEFKMIDFQLKKKSDDTLWIELWIRDEKGESRLYMVPYSQNLLEALEQAKQEGNKTGSQFKFKFKRGGKQNANQGTGSGNDLELEGKIIPREDLLPSKD